MKRLRKLWTPLLLASGLGLSLGTGCIITEEPLEETGGTGGGGSCQIGQPSCPCTASGVCDDGLFCVDPVNICVWPTECDVGSAGCTCTQGGTCDAGLMCADVEPAPGICVSDNPCLDAQIGTEGCQCTTGMGCDPGLECFSGICVAPINPGTTTGDGTSSSGEDPSETAGSSSTGGGSSSTGEAADSSSGGTEPPPTTGE